MQLLERCNKHVIIWLNGISITNADIILISWIDELKYDMQFCKTYQ